MASSEEAVCLYCGGRVPVLRRFRDRRFCSGSHKMKFLAAEPDSIEGSRVHQAKTAAVPRRTRLIVGALLFTSLSAAAPFLLARRGRIEAHELISRTVNRFRRAIAARAGFNLNEDCSNGFLAWTVSGGGPPHWECDSALLARPAGLALYRPSMSLTDYRLDLVGMIDKGALGWVFRAKDFENYYAARLVMLEPGPLPAVAIEHYAVLRGREQPRRVRARLPGAPRADTIYHISLDARGADFTLSVGGRVVAFWTDGRLARGGIGLMAAPGERSRIRSIRVFRHWDALGRMCALLAPPGDLEPSL